MEKEFVPYHIALKLKQLGFTEPCMSIYDLFGEITFEFLDNDSTINSETTPWFVSAPLYQQCFRWLSKEYQIEGWVQPYLSPEPRRCEAKYWYGGRTSCEGTSIGMYDTKEEAELECLVKLIEIVKK